jgi:hypothetical protein
MFFNSIGYSGAGFNTNIYQIALSQYYYSTYTAGVETVVSGTAYDSENNVAPGSSTRYGVFIAAANATPSLYSTVQTTYNYYANTATGIADATTLTAAGGVNLYDAAGTEITSVTGDNLTLLQAEVYALIRLMRVFRPGANASGNVDNMESDNTVKIYTVTDSGYETGAANVGTISSTVYGRTFARKYMNLATGTYIFGVAIINNKLTYNTGDKYRFPFTISDILTTTVSVDTAGAPIASAPGTNLTATIVFV